MVKANRATLAVVACAVVANGCFWHAYPNRLRTHTEVLVSFARKARDLVATGRFTAESLPELTYPLEQATAFADEGRGHAPAPPASLVAFETLLARYRAFVDLVDEVRRSRRGPDGADALAGPLAAVEAAAADVVAAIDREQGRAAPSAPR